MLILKDCMIDALIDYNKKSKHQLRKRIFCTDGPLLNREDVTLLLISANPGTDFLIIGPNTIVTPKFRTLLSTYA